MSDALKYLLEARPEAMSAYFKFIKQAGEHLDPKTRSLISVITKVSGQTEKGFRQYLTRALRDGASADEILDALLMAFPILGLTKIIWAVEQLQALDHPEFAIEALNQEQEWHSVITISDMNELAEETIKLACDGRDLFVYRKDDNIKVYDSHCPHQVTNIPALAIEGDKLTCPKHDRCFDLASGDCIKNGKQPLKAYDTKVEDAQLFAWW